MKLSTAIKVLEKDAEFMGITFEQILVFITRNPGLLNSVLLKHMVYIKRRLCNGSRIRRGSRSRVVQRV